jgi:hypothetical protein
MPEFINEDDLRRFEGWLKYQAVDAATISPQDLAMWRDVFDKGVERSLASPKVGLMKLQPVPGEHLYAVAVREGSDLWLTLWVRYSRKGEFFVMMPRAELDWDVHASYHRDGRLHMKSNGRKVLPPQKHQPLTGAFRATQNLGRFSGHGPKRVGAVCDPTVFSGVVEVGPGVLGPRDGVVIVDLVEPGCEEPIPFRTQIVQREVFHDTSPWIVIRIGSYIDES